MRASRLLSLLMLLQARGRMTAPELARELEVSVRTIYRDIESLSASGVPVYADRGPAGGYQLLAGYRTRLTGLTSDEAGSLFLAGTPGAAAELGLGSVLAAAQLKLLAALPPELAARAGRIQERFHLDVPGWFHDIESPSYLAAVADAVWTQTTAAVRYARWDRSEVARTLEPLGLILKTGVWYVAARAVDGSGPDAQVRTYRVSRIRSIEPGEPFERPPDFDLEAYWEQWSAGYADRVFRDEVIVRLSPWAMGLVGYAMGPVAARSARETASPPDAAGWVTVTLPIMTLEHAAYDLLRFGPQAEAIEPPELRRLVAGKAADVQHLYAVKATDR